MLGNWHSEIYIYILEGSLLITCANQVHIYQTKQNQLAHEVIQTEMDIRVLKVGW